MTSITFTRCAVVAATGFVLGCAHPGVRLTPSLRGDLIVHGVATDRVFADLSVALARRGWTEVYKDGKQVWADRDATEGERASLHVAPDERVIRRLESILTAQGPDVVVVFHTVHVAVAATGQTRVLENATTEDERAGRANADVYEAIGAAPRSP